MKAAYEFDVANNIVNVCGWHPTRNALEAQAAREHPGIPVSHGICPACKDNLWQEMHANLQAVGNDAYHGALEAGCTEEQAVRIRALVLANLDMGNAPPTKSCDDRQGKCLKCGAVFNLREPHVCRR